jgi:hypothetical protein
VYEQEPAVADPAAGTPEPVPQDQDVVQPQEPADLSSEGKKFMISLGLKALRIDSDLLSEDDLFRAAADITDENADDMLDFLMSKVEEHK